MNNNMFGSSSRFGPVPLNNPPQQSSQVSRDIEWYSSSTSEMADGDDNSNMSGFQRSDSVKSLSSLNEQISLEDLTKAGGSGDVLFIEECSECHGQRKKMNTETARYELRKLSLDQHGTFMADFDPEKSKREMRKMNRRIHSKEAKKNILYDEKGAHLETLTDLCDCLDKGCHGCHFPCQRCNSQKCGADCRCNRKYIVDFIEIEGTSTFYQ